MEVLVTHAFNTQEHLIENEVGVLRRVKHPNIIMLIEEVDTPTELNLVMELVKVLFILSLLNNNTLIHTLKKLLFMISRRANLIHSFHYFSRIFLHQLC